MVSLRIDPLCLEVYTDFSDNRDYIEFADFNGFTSEARNEDTTANGH